MKRRIVPLLSILLMAVVLCAAADSVFQIGSDLPAGWYFLPAGVSVSVPDGVEVPSPLPDSVSFTAHIGEYVVGVDFPAGAYSVRCADGVDVTTIKCCREVGGSWYLLESLHSASDDLIGKIELLDGYSVQVRDGSAFFSAPSGIVFE